MSRIIQIGFQNRVSRTFRLHLVFAIVGGLLAGAAVALLSPGSFWLGWLAASLLSIPAFFFLFAAWSWAGGGRLLGWMIALAFLLRLVGGMGLSLGVARYGYDNDCQKAGYLFKDACQRDRESFSIAHKNEGLFWFSGIQLDNDQYGGLAFLSGWIYRYLSPDAHRPFLILIVGSFFTALGVAFLRQALRLRWNDRVANIAVWIYIFYPDAIFFGSSQMREPMLVGLASIGFWAVLTWKQHTRTSIWVFAASFLGMFFFSTRVTLLLGGILAVWFWLDYMTIHSGQRAKVLSWLGLGLGMVALIVLSWNWFRSSSGYDVMVTIKSSGQVETRIQEIGEQWKYLFSVLYGVARPLLPAAIADSDSLPMLRAIGIIRSAGWYFLMPFLAYGIFTLWMEPDPQRRRLALWLIVTFLVWLLVASARGGGDATDNPRYRSLFLPWMALLVAWAVDWSLSHRSVWLWCWVLAEFIFLGFFTHWYLSRYYKLWVKLPFWEMIIWIAGLGSLVFIGGWVYDRFLLKKSLPAKPLE
jgi:hypothetical protein